MIETVFAQLRFAVSLIRDSRIPPRSLDRLIAALQDTRREFGEVNLQGETLVTGPTLDEEKGWTFPRQVAEALEAIELFVPSSVRGGTSGTTRWPDHPLGCSISRTLHLCSVVSSWCHFSILCFRSGSLQDYSHC